MIHNLYVRQKIQQVLICWTYWTYFTEYQKLVKYTQINLGTVYETGGSNNVKCEVDLTWLSYTQLY
jgi:hypothetical protein